MTSVLQEWVQELPLMQQSVLLGAIRGPDGIPKYHPVKYLLRWFRRCVLVSALDLVVLTNPLDQRGGSFTGPSVRDPERWTGVDGAAWECAMEDIIKEFIQTVDQMPHHFYIHLIHAVEIVGYKHPAPRIRDWWFKLYVVLVNDLHLNVESYSELDKRLGDNLNNWLARSHPAITA